MAKQVAQIVSHWHRLTEGLPQSTQEFYAAVQQGIEQRKIPKVDVSRIDYREGGLLSAKREYLRVRRHEYIFDICAAPFGTGFFVSWWLGQTATSWWALIPVIGRLVAAVFRPLTYYRLDTALMFQDSVHSAVLEVLDQLTQAKGLRALSELERKPTLSSLFQNPALS